MIDLVPPHNLEAEQALLGAMMSSTHACDAVIDIVNPEDFYRDSHGLLFRKMSEIRLVGKEPDAVSLAAALTGEELRSVGGKEFLFTLMEFVPSITNAAHYAHIISGSSLRRNLIQTGREITDLGYKTVNAESALDEAEAKLTAVRRQDKGDGPIALADLVREAEARIYDAAHGVRICGRPTHLRGLNALVGGMEPGMYFLLAGRPSVGKSALSMNIAAHMSVDVPVLFFSVEMNRNELVDRLLANTSGVGLSKLRAGDLSENEASKLYKAAQTLPKLHLSIDDTVSTMAEIQRHTRRFAAKTKLGLVVIDYIQLLTMGKGKPESRQVDVSSISRAIKLMAREHKVPVLALSQLNRPDNRYQAEDAKQPRPTLQSLRDSGSLEQDADCVALLYKAHESDNNNVELIIAKARNSAQGTMKLQYVPHILNFEEAN